jgi:hypothetical protein|tara:strand:- start:10439 stop:10942 length:504 start_codon:yes stop_codon:yes gene_type:complete
MPVISGKAYWPKLHTPMGTPMSPDDKRYSIEIGNLDKKNVEAAKSAGLNVKTDDPESGKANAGMKGKFVTLKAYGYDYNGNLNQKPPLVDGSNKQLDDSMYQKLGNGSVVNAKFVSKTTKTGFNMFLLQGVQLVDLVEYDNPNAGDSEDFPVVEGGFSEERIEDSPI